MHAEENRNFPHSILKMALNIIYRFVYLLQIISIQCVSQQ